MPQPEFIMPDFLENNSAEDIHERMMANLPGDIDDMPGGFPYDFTMPTALEKDEFINFHLVRSLMIAFPMYAWDDWLDLHGMQVHISRHEAEYATGTVTVTGEEDTRIEAGTVFCTTGTDESPSLGFESIEEVVIGNTGTATINVKAVEAGTQSNVPANTIVLMEEPINEIESVTNSSATTGGTERENNDDYYDRIAAEYDNSMTYLGNDTDYIRWAKEAGAGDCIVVPAANGPGTVKLVLVDSNGQPASQTLIDDVYNHIVSPSDRSARLLPTACAQLSCVAATTLSISYTITGLIYDSTTSIAQIKNDFTDAVRAVYSEAKDEGVLRYNDVRPILRNIAGVEDFSTFLMQGGTTNITLNQEEYPETGTLNFS